MDQPTRFADCSHGPYCLAIQPAHPTGPMKGRARLQGVQAAPGWGGAAGASARQTRMVLTRLKAADNVPNVLPIASIGAYTYKAIHK